MKGVEQLSTRKLRKVCSDKIKEFANGNESGMFYKPRVEQLQLICMYIQEIVYTCCHAVMLESQNKKGQPF